VLTTEHSVRLCHPCIWMIRLCFYCNYRVVSCCIVLYRVVSCCIVLYPLFHLSQHCHSRALQVRNHRITQCALHQNWRRSFASANSLVDGWSEAFFSLLTRVPNCINLELRRIYCRLICCIIGASEGVRVCSDWFSHAGLWWNLRRCADDICRANPSSVGCSPCTKSCSVDFSDAPETQCF